LDSQCKRGETLGVKTNWKGSPEYMKEGKATTSKTGGSNWAWRQLGRWQKGKGGVKNVAGRNPKKNYPLKESKKKTCTSRKRIEGVEGRNRKGRRVPSR